MSKTTLQRVVAGERLPTRDVVQHLVDLTVEHLTDPPAADDRARLWACYGAALKVKNEGLHRFYTLMTARDEAITRAVQAEVRSTQLAADLGRARRRMERLDARLAFERGALALHRQVAARHLEQADSTRALTAQLRERVGSLTRERQQLQDALQALCSEADRTAAAAAEDAVRIAELTADKESVESELAALKERLSRQSAAPAPRSAEAVADRDAVRSGQTENRAELEVLDGRVRDAEEQHAVAVRTAEELHGQLEAVARELPQARRELVEYDGQLARLVEEQDAARAQPEPEQDALGQADDVLTAALEAMHREYTHRPALPPGLVPAPETTSRPSSASSDDASGSTTDDGVHRPPTRSSAPPPRRRRAAPIALLTGAVVAVATLVVLDRPWERDAREEKAAGRRSPSAPTSASPSAKISASPDNSLGPKDPVFDIADTAVNTEAILKLPRCPFLDVTSTVSSLQVSYGQGESPQVMLTVWREPASEPACRFDLGRTAAVMTVTDGEDRRVWASDDCPGTHTAPRWAKLSGGTPAKATFHWDRRRSRPKCADASGTAPAGTYLAEFTFKGAPPVLPISFRLEKS